MKRPHNKEGVNNVRTHFKHRPDKTYKCCIFKRFLREAGIWSAATGHLNILKLVGYVLTIEHEQVLPCLVSEICEKRVQDFISARKSTRSDRVGFVRPRPSQLSERTSDFLSSSRILPMACNIVRAILSSIFRKKLNPWFSPYSGSFPHHSRRPSTGNVE